MLSRPTINASTILKHNSVMHESYIEQYAQDVDFKDLYATLSHGKHEKHRVEHNFQVGDQAWLYISEDRIAG